jgi:hypothetical protein
MRRGGVEQLEDTLMKLTENIEKSQIGRLEPKQYGASCSGELRSEGRKFRDCFTPCARTGSLLKISHLAARNAVPGDVILFSPGYSSFDQFLKNQRAENVCLRAAKALAPTRGGRNTEIHHNMQAVAKSLQFGTCGGKINLRLASGFFEEKPRRKNNPKNTSQ